MKAIGYTRAGPVDVLVDFEAPTPSPGPRDLLVSVHAVSVNPVDTKVRRQNEPPSGETNVLGYDAAGIVKAVGSQASLFKTGDEVFYAGAINRSGTNAEYHVVDERIVGPKPKTVSFAEAAALPLTAITAWEMLFDRLRVPYGVKKPAGTLLVLAGAGGVGSIMIQLARKLTGLTIIVTASRPETSCGYERWAPTMWSIITSRYRMRSGRWISSTSTILPPQPQRPLSSRRSRRSSRRRVMSF
jgi:zinc-binding alcohol dehydrogenase family protein